MECINAGHAAARLGSSHTPGHLPRSQPHNFETHAYSLNLDCDVTVCVYHVHYPGGEASGAFYS